MTYVREYTVESTFVQSGAAGEIGVNGKLNLPSTVL